MRCLEIVDRIDLDLPATAELPATVILIARPSGEMLAELPPQDLLRKCWRKLFHARVHVLLEQRIAQGQLTDADVKSRIREIGTSEFEEIRSVLKQEDYLLPPRTDLTVYVEFVAVYLELRYFVPSFLRSYFPSLSDFHRIDELLRRDVDGETLLTQTRPVGASDPVILAEVPSAERLIDRLDEAQPLARPLRVPARKRSDRQAMALLRKADHVAQLGNLVRSAILRTRAARTAHNDLSNTLREQARLDIARLVQRLQAALNFTDNEADEWTRSLHSLLDLSAGGIWTAEARVLYDLQKVCVDHERGVYTLERVRLGVFARSPAAQAISARPARRADVQASAERQRPLAGGTPIASCSQPAGGAVAGGRAPCRGQPAGAFQADHRARVGQGQAAAANPPEHVAREKLVDEILDRIVERGFLSMSDLRDGLSRNNLKLPDLASVRQFFTGDQLLQSRSAIGQQPRRGVPRGGSLPAFSAAVELAGFWHAGRAIPDALRRAALRRCVPVARRANATWSIPCCTWSRACEVRFAS